MGENEVNKTIKEIIKEYLQKNGYDALYKEECGCEIDDLMPCEQPDFDECSAGHKVLCSECSQKKECESCPNDNGFCIGKKIKETHDGSERT